MPRFTGWHLHRQTPSNFSQSFQQAGVTWHHSVPRHVSRGKYLPQKRTEPKHAPPVCSRSMTKITKITSIYHTALTTRRKRIPCSEGASWLRLCPVAICQYQVDWHEALGRSRKISCQSRRQLELITVTHIARRERGVGQNGCTYAVHACKSSQSSSRSDLLPPGCLWRA